MNVVDIIREAIATKRTRFAFELLPPLKGDGSQKIFAAIEPLMPYHPAYINITFHREAIKETVREDGSSGTSCGGAPARSASRRPSSSATAWRWFRT